MKWICCALMPREKVYMGTVENANNNLPLALCK
jgi:hypothetical protein